MGKIYVIRHGQTYWNLSKRLQGQKNSRLTLQGRDLARRIAEYLEYQKIGRIYSSTLGRAVQTTRIIADSLRFHKRSIFLLDELSEMRFGELEGRLESKVKEEIQKFLADRADYQFPGGENYKSVHVRVSPAIRNIMSARDELNTLIIGHQAVNRAILGVLLDIPKEKFAKIDHPHHLIYIFDTKTKKMYVYDVNRKRKNAFTLMK